jgi:hypothetical protein
MAMSRHDFIRGARFWVWIALLAVYSAAAAAVLVIDARDPELLRLPQVASTGVDADPAQRQAAGTQLAAALRERNALPLSSLPAGTQFQVVWPDGSRETLQVFDPASALGVDVVTAGDASQP